MRISISDLWFNYDHGYYPTEASPYCPTAHTKAMRDMAPAFILCIQDLVDIEITADELIQDYFNRV